MKIKNELYCLIMQKKLMEKTAAVDTSDFSKTD